MVNMTIGIDRSLCDKSTKMQGLKSPHSQSKIAKQIQDGRHEIQFFDISKSDGGDFPRIIEIAL